MNRSLLVLVLVVVGGTQAAQAGELKFGVDVHIEKLPSNEYQSWNRACRNFADARGSGANCKYLVKSAWSELHDYDKVVAYSHLPRRCRDQATTLDRRMFPAGKRIVETQECLYRALELAKVVSNAFSLSCSSVLGTKLSCRNRATGEQFMLSTVSFVDTLHIIDRYRPIPLGPEPYDRPIPGAITRR